MHVLRLLRFDHVWHMRQLRRGTDTPAAAERPHRRDKFPLPREPRDEAQLANMGVELWSVDGDRPD
jgi:hypothetical protein